MENIIYQENLLVVNMLSLRPLRGRLQPRQIMIVIDLVRVGKVRTPNIDLQSTEASFCDEFAFCVQRLQYHWIKLKLQRLSTKWVRKFSTKIWKMLFLNVVLLRKRNAEHILLNHVFNIYLVIINKQKQIIINIGARVIRIMFKSIK